jgi:HAD superfamily hydrolase (TIGR01509 family)
VTRLSELPDSGALLFDLDGTLVDTVETRIRAWTRTFDEFGISANRDQVARLIGADGKKLAREVAKADGIHLDDKRAEEIDKRSGEVFDELNTDPRPIPGARELLLALGRSEIRWAIATSSRPAQARRSIKALQLPEEPRIVDGSDVPHAKPAPDLLLLAAKELKVSPEHCWYVGDSTWDMMAARAAGMVEVGVAYGVATRSDLLEAGATVVTTYRSLLSNLRRRGLVAA